MCTIELAVVPLCAWITAELIKIPSLPRRNGQKCVQDECKTDARCVICAEESRILWCECKFLEKLRMLSKKHKMNTVILDIFQAPEVAGKAFSVRTFAKGTFSRVSAFATQSSK